LIRGIGPRGWNIRGAYREPEIEYIPAYLVQPFDGFFFVVRGRTGYEKFQYSANTGLKLFQELVFSFSESGCEKCSFSLMARPESLGFTIEDNDLIEIYIHTRDNPAWSGVIIDPGNEWRDNFGLYRYEALGYAPRAKGFLINRTFTGQTVSAIAGQVAQDIAGKDSRMIYDPALISSVPTVISNYKIDKRNGFESMRKISDIAGNYRFAIYGDRKPVFRERSTALSSGCVFHADSKQTKIIKIERSKTDKIKNIYVLERKSASGTGTATVTSNSGSPSDPAYALNGIIRNEESIQAYGEYMAKETIPETANDTDAIRYGVAKCIITAFPAYKIEIETNFDNFSELKIPDGKAIVFNLAELFIDEIENCEDSARWVNGTTASLTANDFRYKGLKSIQLNGSVFTGQYAYSLMPSSHDFSQVRQILFWVYSDTGGNIFDLCYGESAYNDVCEPVFIVNTNQWQLVKIDVNQNFDARYIGIKFNQAGAVNIYLDNFQKYYFGRRKYELEINGVEYTFRANEQKIKFELGSTETPFVDIFVDAWRSIEAQKASGSGGT